LGVRWPLLDVVPEDDRRILLSLAVRRRFAKGEVLFHEGDPGDSLHLVAKGHLAARATTPLGDVATVRVFQPGDFFGELAILSPGPRNATIVALDPVETLALHVSHFQTLRVDHPHAEGVLVHALVAEVRRLSAALVEALYLPVEKRLWRRLLELSEMYGEDPPVEIPLTQEDLAQLAGTTRPTANRILREAEQNGVLGIGRGRIEVRDVETLRRKAR
jgi:CRP-like cAMP-binding protein